MNGLPFTDSNTIIEVLGFELDETKCSCCGCARFSFSSVVGFTYALRPFQNRQHHFDFLAPVTFLELRCPDCGAQRQIETIFTIEEVLVIAPTLVAWIKEECEKTIPPEHRMTPEKIEAAVKGARELYEKIRQALQRNQKGASHE